MENRPLLSLSQNLNPNLSNLLTPTISKTPKSHLQPSTIVVARVSPHRCTSLILWLASLVILPLLTSTCFFSR
ncbi:hypothetical protein S245_021039 [Arachis hypogaea]